MISIRNGHKNGRYHRQQDLLPDADALTNGICRGQDKLVR